MLSRYLTLLADKYRRYQLRKRYSNTIPINPCSSDIYLVAFPKSGVTWLSFLFANIIVKSNNLPVTVNCFNYQDYVPDMHHSIPISSSNSYLPFPGARIIKSHSVYNPAYKKLIYLWRDPVSVIKSLYLYNRGLNFKSHSQTLLEFAKSKRGLALWTNHVSTWLFDSDPNQHIIFLNYDNLLSSTQEALGRVLTSIGWHVSDDVLLSSIQASSLEAMKSHQSFEDTNDPRRSTSTIFSPQFEPIRPTNYISESDLFDLNSFVSSDPNVQNIFSKLSLE